MKDTKTTSGGIGFVGALQILFIALKLLNKIDWSWWLVWSPTWISTLIVILVIVIVVIITRRR